MLARGSREVLQVTGRINFLPVVRMMAGQPPPSHIDAGRVIDYSPDELDRIRRRQEIRRELKDEFNRQCYNPYRNVFRIELHDPALERFMAARAHRWEYWKPTWKSFWTWIAGSIGPIILVGLYLREEQVEKERTYRSGEIPLEKREYKHLYVPTFIRFWN